MQQLCMQIAQSNSIDVKLTSLPDENGFFAVTADGQTYNAVVPIGMEDQVDRVVLSFSRKILQNGYQEPVMGTPREIPIGDCSYQLNDIVYTHYEEVEP